MRLQHIVTQKNQDSAAQQQAFLYSFFFFLSYAASFEGEAQL